MNANEAKLIREMRITAASHRMNGERRTADLLERAAQKIDSLLSSDGKHEYVDCPKGTGCQDCYGWRADSAEGSR